MAMKKKKYCSWDSEVLGENFAEQALNNIEAICWEIITEAKELCPVDEDNLRKSGKVVKDVKNKCLWLSFGDDDVSKKYAVVQHERTDFQHTVGQAKYLKIPYDANKKRILEEIQTFLSKIG